MNGHKKYIQKIDLALDELADNVNVAPVMEQWENVKTKLKQLDQALNYEEFVKENHEGKAGPINP